MCEKWRKNCKSEVKKKKIVSACKSQDFAQSQKISALSHDRTTARFRIPAIKDHF